ncbi:MAG TPA: HK97 family phage prohead protease, partial [Caulobacteraceae bacterium]|nr:HK97 family phage prohead protease [Caulobacteraceae bacterium]
MPQTTLLDLEAFRAQARQGKAPDAATLFKLATTEPQVVGGASSRIRRFVFSDESVDHEGDVIKQSGWDLSVFARNSVALWAHCSWELPIGKAHNVAVRGGKLIGDIEFAEESLYPFANTVFELVKGGFLKAVSVGFIPKDWKFSSDKARPNGLDFIKQLLCEISVVPVPANPAALIEARASGIDVQPLRVWAEQVLSGERGSSLARRDIEATYRHADEPRRGRVTRSAETDQLNECLDDLNASIAGNRETLKTMKALLPSDPYHPYPPPPPGADDYPPAPGPAPDPASTVDPPIDFGPLQTACGHVSEAIARKTKAVGALRDALAGASPGPDSEDPIDTPQARLAEARRLRAQVERSAADWRCGASRDLPLDDSDSWDGPAAEASIW